MGYNLRMAVWAGYIALCGIAVETGVVMVIYLREALDKRLAGDVKLTPEVHPKLRGSREQYNAFVPN
jgi:Cu/Ag efflux pump CusA